MADIRPLNLWGDFDREKLDMLRQAKDRLGVDWYVRVVEARPGCEGGIVALAEPPFVAWDGIAVLTPPYSVYRMERALRQVYRLDEPKNLIHPADSLSKWLGARVVELEEDE